MLCTLSRKWQHLNTIRKAWPYLYLMHQSPLDNAVHLCLCNPLGWTVQGYFCIKLWLVFFHRPPFCNLYHTVITSLWLLMLDYMHFMTTCTLCNVNAGTSVYIVVFELVYASVSLMEPHLWCLHPHLTLIFQFSCDESMLFHPLVFKLSSLFLHFFGHLKGALSVSWPIIYQILSWYYFH